MNQINDHRINEGRVALESLTRKAASLTEDSTASDVEFLWRSIERESQFLIQRLKEIEENI